MKTTAYKVFTHDGRPPIQGGDPIVTTDLEFPFRLPMIGVDSSDVECGAGWNACRELSAAFRIAGLWRTGRPNAAYLVETEAEVIERGNKLRAATWDIVRSCTQDEIAAAIHEMSAPFDDFQGEMSQEQLTWRVALSRPYRDPAVVEAGIRLALNTRGLDWKIREFDSAWAVWDVRAVWDAWDAWDALAVRFSARKGWISHAPDLLTIGIRDAYANGAEIVIPTGPNEIGFSLNK